MKFFIFILGMSCLLQSCIPVRTIERPKLTGYVYNANTKQPIDGCKVNGIYTNSKGYYKIKKISHTDLVPIMSCNIGLCFPRNNDITLDKNGFYSDTIKMQEPYGEARRKGAHWKMDTIFLTRK